MAPRRARTAYLALVALRLAVSLTSLSFIHPDEHFQNTEIAADLVFGYDRSTSAGILKTWEWNRSFPCRSVAPIWASTGAAFAILRLLTDAPSARSLFFAERLAMFALSLALDYIVYQTTHSTESLLLLASSPVMFTFLLRPFSNSLETLLFAVALLLVSKLAKTRSASLPIRTVGSLGGVIALGAFTRITFVAFAAPVIVAVAWLAWRKAWQARIRGAAMIPAVLAQGAPAVLGFMGTSSLLILIDSVHFSSLPLRTLLSEFARGDLSNMALTPANLAIYNLSTSNLAEHGLHPRWLHAVVNWPMLFGAGLYGVASAGRALRRRAVGGTSSERFMLSVYFAAFLIPTALLSVQPHQEPRFLLPLIVPIVALLPLSSAFQKTTTRARKARRLIWAAWITHAVLFTAVFGFMHQAGLIPALFELNEQLARPGLTFLEQPPVAHEGALEIVFWTTFMPPRHLLLPLSRSTDQPFLRVTDLGGSSPTKLTQKLDSLRSPVSATVLVAPAYAIDTLGFECQPVHVQAAEELGASGSALGGLCARQVNERTHGVHFDFDRAGEVFEARWARMGVGIWEIVER